MRPGAGVSLTRRRALQMLAGAGALVVASAWWVAAVELTPASARPYIGGSDDNSVLSLIFGYNGLDRLSGGGGPGGGGANFSGDPGIGRLFNAEMGGQIAWLLPFAAVALVAGIWSRRGTWTRGRSRRRRSRSPTRRARCCASATRWSRCCTACSR